MPPKKQVKKQTKKQQPVPQPPKKQQPPVELKKQQQKKVQQQAENQQQPQQQQQQQDPQMTKNQKQARMFKKYLDDTGIGMAFQVVFAQILDKKVQPQKVFSYTAMRLRQIGQDLSKLKKK